MPQFFFPPNCVLSEYISAEHTTEQEKKRTNEAIVCFPEVFAVVERKSFRLPAQNKKKCLIGKSILNRNSNLPKFIVCLC